MTVDEIIRIVKANVDKSVILKFGSGEIIGWHDIDGRSGRLRLRSGSPAPKGRVRNVLPDTGSSLRCHSIRMRRVSKRPPKPGLNRSNWS